MAGGGDITQGSRGLASDAFAAVTLGLIAGWYYILVGLFFVLAYAILVSGSATAAVVLGVLVADALMPYKPPPLAPNAFGRSWVFESWRAYFGWETVQEAALVPGERYLLAEFPHALYPVGQLLSYGVIDHLSRTHKVSGVVATVLLHTPVLRHFYYATGTRAADAKSIQRILKEGGNAAVVVGGIAEMFMDTSDAERIYLKRRAGFVKLAIREGAHIVPVFFFGNTKTMAKLNSPILRAISRRVKMSIVIFYGRWGTPIPFRHPIKMVLGSPIRVTQAAEPSAEEVEETLARVVDAMAKLYEKHRPAWETRPLVIE
ncbi:diacylglycerol acyltransferase-domain-containing protein [Pavlovales sp. CCMP2436]|nr:diacylglycerol acyltransferase-domain-containing protein [Pavlovales sp. CCMP2436]